MKRQMLTPEQRCVTRIPKLMARAARLHKSAVRVVHEYQQRYAERIAQGDLVGAERLNNDPRYAWALQWTGTIQKPGGSQ